MTKKTMVVLGAMTVLVMGTGAGGFWYLRAHQTGDLAVASAGGAVAIDNDAASNTAKSVPISADAPSSKTDNNALKVTPSPDTGQTNLGSSNSNGSNNNNSNSNENAFSESADSFSQYEKYKDQQQALFGDIVVGTGAEVVANKKVAVNYKGWLTDGKLFDQNKADTPFVFTPGEHRVIAGWEQGVMGMKVGGKRRLIVPPVVGYGSEGKDPIPPNALLIFDIELLAVEP